MTYFVIEEPLTDSVALMTYDGYQGGRSVGCIDARTHDEAVRKFTEEYGQPDNMLSVLVKPMCEAETVFIKKDLASLQKAVEGNIEVTAYPYGRGMDIICNEEAKLIRLPMNRVLHHCDQIYDVICGNFLILGYGLDGERTGLSVEDAVRAFSAFRLPELIAYSREYKSFSSIRCPADVALFIQQNSVSIIK